MRSETSRRGSRFVVLWIAAILIGSIAAAADTAPRLTVEQARAMVLDLLPEVSRIRGLEFEQAVPVHVVDEDGLRRHILDRLDAFGLREQLETTSRAYELLQLVPEGSDLLADLLGALERQVGGFYDPQQGAYFLMDRAGPAAARIYTVHELTHALEDQHFDLDARLREVLDDDDRVFARGAVHEGSASLLMTLYMTTAVLEGAMDTEDMLEIADSEGGATEGLAQLPPVLVRQFLGPYMLGMSFLMRGDMTLLAAGFPVDSVNRAYRDGPRSSEQILHPEKFWDEEQRDDPREVDLNGAGELLGRKWRLRGTGVLGELSLGPLVGATTPVQQLELGMLEAERWTNAAAAGWGGDRWELWARGSTTSILWLTLWDSPKDAREFVEALPESGSLTFRREGDRVAIVGGDAGKRTGRLLDRMLEPSLVGTGATR